MVGDGYIFCKPLGDWSEQRFEVTTHALIGSLDSHECSQAKDFRKGLLFLCFRDPKLFAIYPVLQSNNETENGMCTSANAKCTTGDIYICAVINVHL